MLSVVFCGGEANQKICLPPKKKSMKNAPINETRITFLPLKDLLIGLPVMDAGIVRISIKGSIQVYF